MGVGMNGRRQSTDVPYRVSIAGYVVRGFSDGGVKIEGQAPMNETEARTFLHRAVDRQLERVILGSTEPEIHEPDGA